MILFDQQIDAVSTEGKYVIQADSKNALVRFDMFNDSLYKCAVAFGQDRGYDNADYYLQPHGILLGIPAPQASARSIGGAWFSGQMYLYVVMPRGGTIIASQAPASEFTIVGYAAGQGPATTVAMSRMQNIGNMVQNVGGTASAVQNDANLTGTSVVEATPSGASNSAVSLLNQGVLQLGQNIAGESGQIILLDQNGNAFNGIIQGGKITLPIGIIANLITAQSGNDLGFHVAANQNVIDTVNGIDTFKVNQNGANLLAGTLAFLAGSLSRIAISGPFTVTNSGTSCAHGLGAIPDFVIPIADVGGLTVSTSYGVNFGTMTTTNVTVYCASSVRTWLLSIKK